MTEPDFSESQLQQAANAEFIDQVKALNGHKLFVRVPSLVEENNLGWDSAAYLPWAPELPSDSDHGCNFFLQYKLSNELNSPGAKEWHEWLKPYFRFRIPHRSKDDDGKLFDDYQQWERLKALADKGYPTYYATNATLKVSVLMKAYENGEMLKLVPLLDVRGVRQKHKHVTFTDIAKNFSMHSEREEAQRMGFNDLLEKLIGSEKVTLKVAVDKLILTLKAMSGDDENWINGLQKLESFFEQNPGRPVPYWLRHSLIASFIHVHSGVNLYWMSLATDAQGAVNAS
jgi:hypothetical protein